jgi:hypothetical protein
VLYHEGRLLLLLSHEALHLRLLLCDEALVAQLQQAKAFVTDLALWKRRGVGRGGDDDLVMCGAVADIHVDWAQWRFAGAVHHLLTCDGRWLYRNYIA